MSLQETGIVTKAELMEAGRYPSEERMRKGPVAVCECMQNIPCNPCETACPFNAIHVGENISNLPELEEEKCTGCSTCIAACSGLALFVVDKSYSEEVGSVSFPYEYNFSFHVGDTVKAADRSGKYVCEGRVKRVVNTKKSDRTPVVTLEIPITFVDEVRSVYRQRP